ncbi:MAG TPA: GTPase Era [Candidatus Acidoferrales bacterium]|nr:GTPase Era [Candidatus Acidoferrales bacterium]
MPKHKKAKKGTEPKEFRSGFVAIIGRPNVGKSTLVNRLVGQKVSIVTSKPQTTRNRIQGIVNRKNAQIVLIDTPGWHDAHNLLGRQMLSEIVEAIEGVDVLALMADANSGIGADNDGILQRAAEFKGPAVLLLNKIDRIPKEKLLPLIADYSKARDFAAIVPISALTGDGIEEALSEIINLLPEGQPLFPTDQFTDQPERFLAGEIVREKVMALTKQEIPHSVAVLVDTFEESPSLIRIRATIYVEREGQKGIVIGKGGAMLKSIGTQARVELESILGTKVFLELFVKAQPEWRNSASMVKQLDWHTQIEQLGGNESEDTETP